MRKFSNHNFLMVMTTLSCLFLVAFFAFFLYKGVTQGLFVSGMLTTFALFSCVGCACMVVSWMLLVDTRKNLHVHDFFLCLGLCFASLIPAFVLALQYPYFLEIRIAELEIVSRIFSFVYLCMAELFVFSLFYYFMRIRWSSRVLLVLVLVINAIIVMTGPNFVSNGLQPRHFFVGGSVLYFSIIGFIVISMCAVLFWRTRVAMGRSLFDSIVFILFIIVYFGGFHVLIFDTKNYVARLITGCLLFVSMSTLFLFHRYRTRG